MEEKVKNLRAHLGGLVKHERVAQMVPEEILAPAILEDVVGNRLAAASSSILARTYCSPPAPSVMARRSCASCRYCPHCDLLIAHQGEIGDLLTVIFLEQTPEIIGNEYLVLGTVDRHV